jgi:hypothetical protein
MAVYDMTGRLVADLSFKTVRGEAAWHAGPQPAGCYIVSAAWNGMKLSRAVILCK